jgi:uncharacterized membrane protein YphA (DoxX/SURF4 family)
MCREYRDGVIEPGSGTGPHRGKSLERGSKIFREFGIRLPARLSTLAQVPLQAPKNARRHLLPYLFPTFPGGWPGIALLLLRAALGIALSIQGGFYLGDPDPTPATWCAGLATLAAGTSLSIGFLTPLASALAGLSAIGVGFSLTPACARTLFDAKLPIIFAVTMLVAIFLLGPGAFSVDAQLFGRREIIIPPVSPSRR